jgi:hypothetical protein
VLFLQKKPKFYWRNCGLLDKAKTSGIDGFIVLVVASLRKKMGPFGLIGQPLPGN